MLRKILEITWLHIKTTYQDRSALIFGVLMPIVFTLVIGVGIQGFAPDDEETQTWRIDVINQDEGQLGGALLDSLAINPILEVLQTDAGTAAQRLEAGESAATLILPPDMSASLLSRRNLALEFRLNAEDPLSGQVVEQALLAAIDELSSSLDIAEVSTRVADQLGLFATSGPSHTQFFSESFAAAQNEWRAGAPITVEAQKETRRQDTSVKIPLGFEQSSPGIAVMFAMFFVLAGAGSILQEREQGTLRRLLVTPIRKSGILAGKLFGVFITAVIQFSILVLAGQLFFGVDWGQSPAALALMILAFTFSITALGMFAASLVRTYAQIDAISTILILPLSGLGGAMWPIEIVPDFMQRIALWVPTGWAMRGFHDIITRGLGLQDVLLEAGVLVAFGLVFLTLGIWRFKYE
ncbi:MAG: ABC transporter permease [Chloroflexi bacterium]|nr:ABC transporter permease [Chloroflexota bacterium]MQC25937.1 ABC transporter permease [Chloroflexota bacterium]